MYIWKVLVKFVWQYDVVVSPIWLLSLFQIQRVESFDVNWEH
jgi:hypothetical protein